MNCLLKTRFELYQGFLSRSDLLRKVTHLAEQCTSSTASINILLSFLYLHLFSSSLVAFHSVSAMEIITPIGVVDSTALVNFVVLEFSRATWILVQHKGIPMANLWTDYIQDGSF